MLRLLMNAAVHWMKAGLALRSLKIVIFSRNIDKISKADQPLFDLFQELKENYAQDEKQGAEIKVTEDCCIHACHVSSFRIDMTAIPFC